MPRPSRRSASAPSSRWKKILLWGVPGFFVLLIVGFFILKAAVYSYLQGEGFRRFLAEKAGTTMRAEVNLSPLEFTGTNIFTNHFQAQGGEDAPFALLELNQLRTEINLRRFFDKVWQIDQVEIQRLNLNLTGPRADLPPAPPLGTPTYSSSSSSSSGWLPNRVELTSAIVRDTNLIWKGGAMKHTVLSTVPDNGGWKITGAGGKIEQGTMPGLDVRSLNLLYRAPSLFVHSAELRHGDFGSVKVDGEINFEERIDLRAAIRDLDINPFLPLDWRVRLKGQLSGDVTVRGPLPLPATGPEIAGSVSLGRGELTALPVLDQIAIFTGTQQFRRIALSKASADFRQEGSKLRVTKFLAESEGLIRMEGDFIVENGKIDGTFQVGVSPSSLIFIPNSQEKVFTESRGGYVWAPMRIWGPLNDCKEDLTPRLIAAAGGAIIDTAKGAVEKGIETGKGAVQGIFDWLMPGTKKP